VAFSFAPCASPSGMLLPPAKTTLPWDSLKTAGWSLSYLLYLSFALLTKNKNERKKWISVLVNLGLEAKNLYIHW
jgi:hypothetical protein